jgi:5'(3')-deoxyribonucleotidase
MIDSMRPTIIIDLDNVLYPFSNMMAMVIAKYTDTEYNPMELAQLYNSWAIWEDWDIPKGQFDWWWERAIRDGAMYTEGFPIQGGVKAMWELSDMDWHIHIVTSRLNKFRLHDKAVASTVKWLAEFGIPYRSLSFTAEKDAIYADAIVDDRPENLINHPAPHKYLFPAPHNKDVRTPSEIMRLEAEYPWSDLLERLKSED